MDQPDCCEPNLSWWVKRHKRLGWEMGYDSVCVVVGKWQDTEELACWLECKKDEKVTIMDKITYDPRIDR